ncbi:hypothetical protein [Mycoplasma hafezii]|uniref:hypothetical protein n=1 Tax=Mycoplasma hafezii TaxID=525886 RepID=UPI003CF0C996
MEYLLKNTFLWQIGISEFISLSFLITMSFLSTYLGKKYKHHNHLYGTIYGLSVFLAGLLAMFILRGISYLEHNEVLLKTNTASFNNPMGTFLFIFVYIFSNLGNLDLSQFVWINLLWLILIHLLAIVCACTFWSFIRKRFKLNNDFKHVDVLQKREIGLEVIFMFLLVLIVYIISFRVILKDPFWDAFTNVAATGLGAMVLLIIISFFRVFSFPTNIYVSLASFFMSVVHKKTKFVINFAYFNYTIVSFAGNAFLVSLLTFI